MAGKKHRASTTTSKTSDANEIQKTRMVRADPMAVPELLNSVLSFATQSTLASCAVVCKPWSEAALDRLWKHLDSVFPLLELVMSLVLLKNLELRVPNALQTLSDKLGEADWPRFQYYSSRVRSLVHNCDTSYRAYVATPDIAPEAIGMLCLHHPTGLTILPRLETLTWSSYGPATSILPFLSPQVKVLEVDLAGGPQLINSFFRAIHGRTPNLKTFTLKTPTRAVYIEEAFQKAVCAWKNLETLKVPPFYLRPSILGAAASLPNLTTLEQDYTHHNPYDEAAVLQKLPENAFPQLTIFGFNCSPASAQKLAQKYSGLFTRLTSIHLGDTHGVNNEDVLKFAHHLGKKCVNLTSISLNLRLGSEPNRGETSPLTFEVLESLFPCRQLQMLEIGHPYPLTINETDVEQMAAAWPKLTVFNVCTEPDPSISVPGHMGNSLQILPAFARHFPQIEDIGLYFAKGHIPRFSGDLYADYEFHKLYKLNVGVSAVPGGRSQDIGFLIASLCRFEPTIEFGLSVWYEGGGRPQWREYERQWEETSKCLEFAMRTKMAGRAKAKMGMD